ncbi:hypothetical protein M407DRAFT_4994 [Tulasnella calospora MUT 4182]|uniref:Uncharacterized protein n=1 Tax=Tulasnella calospora MUT 4182 TaxID=1051891 RepID=A0A0C3QHV3_9AGAM|nr:hypothetical protein M407DRAFT_4994 [Tulasnella calospora MUT 4182]
MEKLNGKWVEDLCAQEGVVRTGIGQVPNSSSECKRTLKGTKDEDEGLNIPHIDQQAARMDATSAPAKVSRRAAARMPSWASWQGSARLGWLAQADRSRSCAVVAAEFEWVAKALRSSEFLFVGL